MGRTIIGAVWIVLESEGGAFAADASVQEPPKALVVELREIGHRILSRSNCGALCGADAGRNALLDAVSGTSGSDFEAVMRSWKRYVVFHLGNLLEVHAGDSRGRIVPE